MKTKLIAICILISSVTAFAQHEGMQRTHHPKMNKEQKEKIKAQKVAFITTELNLNADEAQKFWPVYNEFENKRHALRKARKNNGGKKMDDMTDSEIEAMINAHLDSKEQELALHKEYINKFKTVLSIKKVAQLHLAEEKFKRQLLQQLRIKRTETRAAKRVGDKEVRKVAPKH